MCVRWRPQVKWQEFDKVKQTDTIDGKEKERQALVPNTGSPAQVVEHFLNLLRGHKQASSCKCENQYEIRNNKLTFRKTGKQKKHEKFMKKKFGFTEVPPHLVRARTCVAFVTCERKRARVSVAKVWPCSPMTRYTLGAGCGGARAAGTAVPPLSSSRLALVRRQVLYGDVGGLQGEPACGRCNCSYGLCDELEVCTCTQFPHPTVRKRCYLGSNLMEQDAVAAKYCGTCAPRRAQLTNETK